MAEAAPDMISAPAPCRIAVVGLGKIARDQHLPAIAADPAFTLAATVSPNAPPAAGVPHFADLEVLLASGIALDAVALCTPPGPRPALTRQALAAGCDVLMEKPPAVTPDAARCDVPPGRTLFAAWHSRFAPGVAPARAALAGQIISFVEVIWHEDVRRWHPGQDWIWQADGFGVLDPGINALSILTAILPFALDLTAAELDIPEGRATPIAARLSLAGPDPAPIRCDFDWRPRGPDIWRIAVTTIAGRQLVLNRGGHDLLIDGERVALPETGEYPALYRHFAALRAAGASDCDLAPLRLAADTLSLGTVRAAAPFEW